MKKIVLSLLSLSLTFIPLRLVAQEAVDMGLSVKWANCDLGAESPEQQGCLFAWGEVSPKDQYTSDTYKWGNSRFKKYSLSGNYGYAGFVDNKNILDDEDDAAHVLLGGDWHIPSCEQWQELLENCKVTGTKRAGRPGLLFKSKKNGNSIFLPSGLHWSSSLYEGLTSSAAGFGPNNGTFESWMCHRENGLAIRPVYGSRMPSSFRVIPVDSLELSQTSLILEVGKSARITATVFPNDSSDEVVCWNSQNNAVAEVSGRGYSGFIETSSMEEVYIRGVSPGFTSVVVSSGGKQAVCQVQVKVPPVSRGKETSVKNSEIICPYIVDMGLSVLWADANLGAPNDPLWAWENGDVEAASTTDMGYRYAFGETAPKREYTLWNYKWHSGDGYFKYGTGASQITVLDLEDDAARVSLGRGWRIPTKEEWEELRTNCTFTYSESEGVKGYWVKSKINGNSIFLPLLTRNGYSCLYRTSSVDTRYETGRDHICNYVVAISPNAGPGQRVYVYHSWHPEEGCYVRPVKDKY